MARLPSLLGLALLAGCAAKPVVVAPAAPPPPPGMELLLGKPADVAVALLGKPKLDRREGPARQLQFASACVLDLFYYQQPGQPQLATHAESRLVDGRQFAPGECLQLLLNAKAQPG
jgi:hypothetical protein